MQVMNMTEIKTGLETTDDTGSAGRPYQDHYLTQMNTTNTTKLEDYRIEESDMFGGSLTRSDGEEFTE